jgi:hypothetical protein
MIKFVILIEWAILTIGALLIVTQIIVPAVRGRPLFPILRSRGRHVEKAVASAKEDIDISAQEKELAELKAKPGQ